MTCGDFLRMNGWNLVSDGVDAADRILALIDGSLDRDGFAEWLAAHSRQRPSFELRDFFATLDLHTLGSAFAGLSAGASAEHVATIAEAAEAIPVIDQASLAAARAHQANDTASADILRHHATLLTAIYRVAEDMGYEW